MSQKNIIIQEIQKKLGKGNMSVLVGAGFSKNANGKYPSWPELLEDMIIKDVYLDEFEGFKDKKLLKYKNYKNEDIVKKDFIDKVTKRDGYLEIVDKYIKQKGYPEAITTYIEERFLPIEENEILNLELPELLLSLPWNNVYTTNYDTVLERASNNLGGLSYKTVINSEDLSISTQKRIIKLHGSLRTKEERDSNYFGRYGFDGDNRTQYIIAKNDYETYPEKHSAFTHLMRIALLQESFCLIGFSGDDPNFLNWIEWVKDVLKGKDKKVYLIDVNSNPLSEDKKLFFKNLGIERIILKDIYNTKDFYKMLKAFFDELNDDLKLPESIKIKSNYNKMWYDLMQNNKLYLEILKYEEFYYIPSATIANYASNALNREAYTLYENIMTSIEYSIRDFGYLSLLLRGSYLNLKFIYSDEQIDKMIVKFKLIEFNDLDDFSKTEWLNFSLSILKFAKYENNEELLKEWKDLILSKDNINLKIKNEVYYEEILFYITALNYSNAYKALYNWVIDENDVSNIMFLIKKVNLLSIFRWEDKVINPLIDSIKKLRKKVSYPQEKLWIDEILRFYNISISPFTNNESEIFDIQRLKSMGFYTLDDIKDEFLKNNNSNQRLKPMSNDRYHFSPITIGGVDSNLKNIQFIEFMFTTSIPCVINLKYPLTYLNKERFVELYNLFPLLLLSNVFQYEYKVLSFSHLKALIEKIIFSNDISYEEKKEVANKVINIFNFYLNSKNIIHDLYITIVSMFLNILNYSDWKDFYRNIRGIIFPNKNTSYISDDKICSFFQNIDDLDEVKDIFSYLIKSDFDISKYIGFLFAKRSKIFLKKLYPLIEDELKNIILSNDFNKEDFIKIIYFDDFYIEEIKTLLINKLKLINIDDFNEFNLRLFTYLSFEEKVLISKVKKYLINKNIFNNKGINDMKSISTPHEHIHLDFFINRKDNKLWLNWNKEELIKFYDDIDKTMSVFDSDFDDKHLKVTKIKIIERITVFLEGNKKTFKNISGYKEKLNNLKEKLENLREYSDIQFGIISKDNDKTLLALNDLLSYYQNNPKKEIPSYWYPLLIKILKFEEPKLEFALEVLSKTLFYSLKNEDWPKKLEYRKMYIDILEKYYNYEYLEETELDREFVEIQLLSIAYTLKNHFKFRDKILTKVLKLSEESIFNTVKNFNF